MVAATRSAWNKLLFQQSVTLENSRVKLVPLKREFYSGLLKEALDPRIWAFPFAYHLRDETSWNAYFEDALRQFELQTQLPFAVLCKQTSELVGMTRFYDINERHLTISLGIKSQRTGMNRNNKFLIGDFVFNYLKAERLHFDIDNLNQQSRNNLLGIGAKEEGVLRNHRFKIDTSKPMNGLDCSFKRRDTAVFSILRTDWPQLKSTVFKNYEQGIITYT